MPTVKTVTVVYTGPSPAVEGAGFVFPRNEPVEVPADLADSLIRGDFAISNGKDDN